MEFTEEQKKVIECRNKNILVSAAAGSGKTAVLVERMVKRVLDENDPVDIDRILTVTFTNAAASEMRERIRKRLSDELHKRSGDKRIKEQLCLIHNANIMTIDSFCVRVLRENFEEAGIDPAFRVGDENETALLREDACDEILNEAYEEGSEEFYRFLDMCSPGKDDRDLSELIQKLSKAADSRVDPLVWLKELPFPYGDPGDGEPYYLEYLISVSDLVLNNTLKAYDRLLSLSGEADGPYMYSAVLSGERDNVASLLEKKTYSDRYKALSLLSFKSLSPKKDENVDPEKKDKVKNHRNKLKESLRKLKDELFSKDREKAVSEMKDAYPAVKVLTELTLKFRERYSEKKALRSVLDFSDVEHMALKVLKSPAGDSYRDFFSEVMTDEYQDSNSLQEAILTEIAVNDNYFTVGDVKQSIYGFRLAEPGIFMRRFDQYSGDEKNELILLNKNFRSRRSVTEPVNSLFRLIMHPGTGGIEYDETQELIYGEGYDEDSTENRAEFTLIEKDEENELEDLELEAAFIAGRIEALTGSFEVTENKEGRITKRRAEYSDFCILMRSVSGYDDIVRDVLKGRGIPAVIEGKNGYFKTREVRDVLNYLTVLDNPRQDIPLIAAMKSPFGGFSDGELAEIRSSCEEGLLIDALENGDYREEIRKKTDVFISGVEYFRSLIPYTPIHELIRLIIKRSYSLYVSSLEGSGRENLELLIKRSADFESTNYRGLFSFLRYIERIQKYEMDFSEASAEGSLNAVRILSIHKSKGLEFPVVFLMNINKRFNITDVTSDIICHRDLGLGISLIDPEKRIKYKTILHSAVARRMKLDDIGEELRILYVALTRAKEKLIVSGVVKDSEKSFAKPCSMESASSFLDFFLCAIQEDGDGSLRKCFDISSVNTEGLTADRVEEGLSLSAMKSRVLSGASPGDEALLSDIPIFPDWSYPYEKAILTPSKVSVSELKKKAMEDDDFLSIAEGIDITELLSGEGKNKADKEDSADPGERRLRIERMQKAAEAGTAFHKVMSLIPPELGSGKNDVEDFLSVLMDKGSILKEERDLVKSADISDFLKTDIWRRMSEAGKNKDLFREQPFIVSRSASYVFPDGPENERVQIQGIIDVFFIEDGSFSVMDYKTDNVDSAEALIKRYRKQLELYGDALKGLLCMPLKDMIIYSVKLKKEIFL